MPGPNLKEMIENHLNLKCESVFTEHQAVIKIQKSLDSKDENKSTNSNKYGYKHFIIDMKDYDTKLQLEYHMKQLGPSFKKMEQ